MKRGGQSSRPCVWLLGGLDWLERIHILHKQPPHRSPTKQIPNLGDPAIIIVAGLRVERGALAHGSHELQTRRGGPEDPYAPVQVSGLLICMDGGIIQSSWMVALLACGVVPPHLGY